MPTTAPENPDTDGDSWIAFLRERVGERWVLASRLTDRLRAKGYTVALSQARYTELEREWETQRYGAPLKTLQAVAPDMLSELRKCEDMLCGAIAHAPRIRDLLMGRLTATRAVIAAAEGRPVVQRKAA